MRSTAKVCSVRGTGVNGSGMETCAQSRERSAADDEERIADDAAGDDVAEDARAGRLIDMGVTLADATGAPAYPSRVTRRIPAVGR